MLLNVWQAIKKAMIFERNFMLSMRNVHQLKKKFALKKLDNKFVTIFCNNYELIIRAV